jgi:hypothetical protein
LAKNILGLVLGVIFAGFCVLAFLHSSSPEVYVSGGAQSFSSALWEFRPLDVFVQLLVILGGIFGILTLVRRSGQ